MSESSADQRVSFRLWLPVLLVAAEFAVSELFEVYGSSHLHSMIGNAAVHVLAAIGLVAFWLFSRGVSWRERRYGVVIFVVALVVLFLSQLPTTRGRLLIIHALPAFNVGMTAALIASAWLPWRARRAALALCVLAWTVFFSAQRVQEINSDFIVATTWRWETHGGTQTTDSTPVEVHGTATLPSTVGPGDWPGFRGAARDGHVTGVTFASDWSTPPKQLWRRGIGPGHGSVAIVGEVLFTQEQAGDTELVACYNAATGEPIWTNSVIAHHDDALGGEGPRATPTYADCKVYAQSGGGLLQCLDASTGNVVWKHDLATQKNPSPPMYGFTSSPLVLDGLVIQYSSGGGDQDMVALDAATGAERWRAAKDSGGYGSPQLFTIGGVRQVLMLDSLGVHSVEPATGKAIWSYDWHKRQFPRCLQPVLASEDTLALGANADFGTRLIRVSKSGEAWDAKEEWTNGKHRPYYNDNIGHKGFLYGFDGNRLCCVDLKTGESKWQGERCGGQLVVVDDLDLLLVLTEKGVVMLVKADPASFQKVASFSAIQGKTWNHPAIAHGKLYVRNSEEMACYELSATAKVAAESK